MLLIDMRQCNFKKYIYTVVFWERFLW